MKKLITCLVVGAVLLPSFAFASVGCSQINGASIYGYDPLSISGSDWTYIGSVSSQYDVNSIANQYGLHGSQYSINSIFDQYGQFGSLYSYTSAMNTYASDPPVLVTTDGEWAYVSANQYKTPSINPYFALMCAKQSYVVSSGN